MKRIKYPVKTITRKRARELGIQLDRYPRAGPYANVTGMRNLYWGVNAPIIKVGVYIYHVPMHVYNRI